MDTAISIGTHEVLESLRKEIDDNALTEELAGCGGAVPQIFARAVADGSVDAVESLLHLATDHVQTVPFNLVKFCWLRLYTDATIALCALRLRLPSSIVATEAIRLLDTAIIVAGAVGRDRMSWIQELIRSWQRHLQPDDILDNVASHKRVKHDTALQCAPNAIPALARPPSLAQYAKEAKDRPFILRSYLAPSRDTDGWRATHLWNSGSYLLRAVGPGRIVPVELGRSYNDTNWGQQLMPFADFLRISGFYADETKHERPAYLAQYALFEQFPQLRGDFSLPDYVWSQPDAPSSYPSYEPPSTDDGVIVNAWLGSASSEIVSPAHTDPYYNCYAQVLGRKRVWVAPPSAGRSMYAYADHESDDTDAVQSYMTNTSRVPIFREGFSNRSLYPRFFEEVWPMAMEAVLEPGDMLVMPPGWWHAMRGEGGGVSWSVSMWF